MYKCFTGLQHFKIRGRVISKHFTGRSKYPTCGVVACRRGYVEGDDEGGN